jgi:hypothetical protein
MKKGAGKETAEEKQKNEETEEGDLPEQRRKKRN